MKTKSLLLVSALSLLPLTSMGADATKTPSPNTGGSTVSSDTFTTAVGGPAATQKGSTAPGYANGGGFNIGSTAPSTSATKTPAPPQLNHSTVSSSAPGTSQLKTAGFTASNPSSKGVGGSGGAGSGVGNAVYSAGDLKAPSAPK